ncbi:PLP-dependent aminotransferase family protein [Thalassomonas viridans]|uniref:PLP-dependent aminotransferase family protein n=1 Tax=Thalassomonas viridans TaxID=137584 RepID=A0AAE9Z7G3_9GAMM|nr:PLP-dependent aminotransferase family protein [Thalassomonas viridans]WDE07445.1 PLP-dependent aminotransferase family protein [Thalassomonas viridans]
MWSPDLSQETGPLYQRLVSAMAKAISSGELAVGDKLPPQRQLAWHLGVNLSTVTKAFQEATKRHLIYGEVGRGTFILGKSTEAALFELKQGTPEQFIDLSTHVPAVNPADTHLENTLAAMLNREANINELLNYHSPRALQEMKIAAAKWLAELGYHISPAACITTTSAQNALLITLLTCCDKGDTVLVDELTFPGIKAVARVLGLKLYGIKMDHQGMLPASLELAVRTTKAKVLVSDPTLQNPTGSSMGEARKQAYTEVITRHNILFIEEFVVGALAGTAPVSGTIKNHSVLITSFAKTVAPGIRFAILAGEHDIIKQIDGESHVTSWQLSPLMADIAQRWIHDGTATERLRWQQQEIKQRYQLFKQIFAKSFCLINRGCSSHVWLPVPVDADAFAEKCQQHGIAVVPASLFAAGHQFPQCIRVSLTAAKDRQQLKAGLEVIRDLVNNETHDETKTNN